MGGQTLPPMAAQESKDEGFTIEEEDDDAQSDDDAPQGGRRPLQ
jgi:hypothetical protein